MSLHLMRPEWLWCFVPALLLAALLWRSQKRRGSWRAVIAPELLPHLTSEDATGKQRNMALPILLLWSVAVLAAAGPSWEKIPQPVHQFEDAVVVLLDLSLSMKSADLPPSRIDRARQKVQDLLAKRREGQTAVIAYAGDAHIVTPLTDDVTTIANLLPALHPDMMPVPGSDPAAALRLGLELFRSAGVQQGRVLLITDALTYDQQQVLAELIEGSGVRLSILGVGTATGAPIPLERGGFARDATGAIVMPALDEKPLAELARKVNGRYQPLSIDDRDVTRLLSVERPTAGAQTISVDRTADAWHDQGYLFVLLLLPAALLLFRRGWLLGLLPLCVVFSPGEAHAVEWESLWYNADQRGQKALQEGDTARAAELFDSAEWAGLAAYRSGEYDTATELFSNAPSADAWYNRGNALARQGNYDEAIAAYEESLKLLPDQRDALDNIELLKQLQQQYTSQDQNQQQKDRQQEGQQQKDPQQGSSSEGNQSAQSGEGRQNQGAGSGGKDSSDAQQSADGQKRRDREPGTDTASDRRADAQTGSEPGREEQERPEQNGEASGGDGTKEKTQQEDAASRQPNSADKTTDESGDTPGAARAGARSTEELEREQAMEQWLRRVPDDPAGLLRQKFRYESELRRQQGAVDGVQQDGGASNEIYW